MINWSSLRMAEDNRVVRKNVQAEFHSAKKFGEGMALRI
jgi:hypothetical protein